MLAVAPHREVAEPRGVLAADPQAVSRSHPHLSSRGGPPDASSSKFDLHQDMIALHIRPGQRTDVGTEAAVRDAHEGHVQQPGRFKARVKPGCLCRQRMLIKGIEHPEPVLGTEIQQRAWCKGTKECFQFHLAEPIRRLDSRGTRDSAVLVRTTRRLSRDP